MGNGLVLCQLDTVETCPSCLESAEVELRDADRCTEVPEQRPPRKRLVALSTRSAFDTEGSESVGGSPQCCQDGRALPPGFDAQESCMFHGSLDEEVVTTAPVLLPLVCAPSVSNGASGSETCVRGAGAVAKGSPNAVDSDRAGTSRHMDNSGRRQLLEPCCCVVDMGSRQPVLQFDRDDSADQAGRVTSLIVVIAAEDSLDDVAAQQAEFLRERSNHQHFGPVASPMSKQAALASAKYAADAAAAASAAAGARAGDQGAAVDVAHEEPMGLRDDAEVSRAVQPPPQMASFLADVQSPSRASSWSCASEQPTAQHDALLVVRGQGVARGDSGSPSGLTGQAGALTGQICERPGAHAAATSFGDPCLERDASKMDFGLGFIRDESFTGFQEVGTLGSQDV
mmetsp:Transcript_88749/g.231687  ORF Transcript_88749/g.231687 Transcript_88749/m.231687 type:complete len:399 (-) Transcript_88749:35-1231(-)